MKIKKFKTSQWIMAIIVLSLGQLLIHYYSTQVMSGSEVINYMSFAGTIVSIILAVLAIIYSFYQSFTQQNNVDSIAREIEKLKKTSKEINKSSEGIKTASECLPKMLSELESLPSIISSAVAHQVNEQTGVLLGDHATDLKAFIGDYISKSASISMSGSERISDDSTGGEGYILQLSSSEMISITCATASYIIMAGINLNVMSNNLGRVFDKLTHQAVMSGASSIIVALIMAGELTIDKDDNGVKVKEVQFINKKIGSFVVNALKGLNDLSAGNNEYIKSLRAELSDIPNGDDEILKRINERFIMS